MNIRHAVALVAVSLYSVQAGAQGSISGTVYDSLRTHAPLANATVVLVETSRYATTDERGHFEFDSVAAGRVTVGFTHAVLDSLDLQGPLAVVNVAAGERAAVMLATPSAATMYARLCPGVRDTSTAMVIGRVRDVDDRTPLADAAITTDWTEYRLAGGRTASVRMRAATKSNAGGLYLLCGVPKRVPLEIRTELTGFVVGPTQLQLDARLFTRADFAISRKDDAARELPFGALHADSVAFANRDPGTATLRGVVLGADGKPLRDATVSVVGTDLSARSNASGTFRVAHIPAGTRTLEVKSVGMLPVVFSMDFPTHGTRDTSVSIGQRAQELKPVNVEGQKRPVSLMEADGYEARRAHGLGAYVTADQIAKHNFPDLASILRGVRGVRVDCNATKPSSKSGQGIMQGISCLPMPAMLGVTDFNSVTCVPNVFLDGVPFVVTDIQDARGITPDPARFQELSEIARPEMIRGIEVYSSAGSTPAQYDRSSTTGCGLIVIWTR